MYKDLKATYGLGERRTSQPTVVVGEDLVIMPLDNMLEKTTKKKEIIVCEIKREAKKIVVKICGSS